MLGQCKRSPKGLSKNVNLKNVGETDDHRVDTLPDPLELHAKRVTVEFRCHRSTAMVATFKRTISQLNDCHYS